MNTKAYMDGRCTTTGEAGSRRRHGGAGSPVEDGEPPHPRGSRASLGRSVPLRRADPLGAFDAAASLVERLLQGPASESRSFWAALRHRREALLAEADAESARRILAADTKRTVAQKDNIAARRQLMEAMYGGRLSAAEHQLRLSRALQRAHIGGLPAALSHDAAGEELGKWLGILERQRDIAEVEAQWRAHESAGSGRLAPTSVPAVPIPLPDDALVAARTADDLREAAEFHYARLVRANPERRQAELSRVVSELRAAGYTPNEAGFIQSAISEKLRRYG